MHLLPGQTLAHYEIEGELGRGGMGEVYRARDTRLDRAVALKLLPPALVGSSDGLRRFEREAKLLASLNHPNVAIIHGIERVGDEILFLALELVPGESLADRLRRDPPSIDRALAFADQIAAGLEAAHGRGIVHRDLKPANVMITPQDGVKLLDFGLAKVAEPDAAGAPAPESEVLTEAGRVFGTPNYMSPEQIEGEAAQTRSDIWAFGCLLYEMLSGERAFSGPSLTAILARVTTGEPDWARLPGETPARIARLVRRCLRHDPAGRPETIAEVRRELAAPDSSAPRRAVLLLLGALALLVLLLLWLRPTATSAPTLPASRTLALAPLALDDAHRPLLSPDARRVVFRAGGALRVHELDTGATHALPRTSAASHPFWAPDSRAIGFRRDRALLALELATGEERLLARLGGPWNARGGAAWLDDGSIVFTSGLDGDALYRLPAASAGARARETLLAPAALAGVRHFHDPAPLPGGRVLVVLHRSTGGADALGTVEDGAYRELVRFEGDELGHPTWSDDGHILLERASNDPVVRAGVWALSLTPGDFAPAGDPFPLAPGSTPAGAGAGGRWLRIAPELGAGELLWIDRSGETTPLGVVARAPRAPSLSPNGNRIAMVVLGPDGAELRVHDLDVGRGRLLGPAPAGGLSWSPRSTQLAYAGPAGMILLRNAFGDAEASELFPGRDPELTPNGLVLFAGAEGDLWSLRLGATAPTRLTTTPERESAPHLSPDGRFLAYLAATEDGGSAPALWVAPFPPRGLRWPVAEAPAMLPRWSPTGDELFFVRDGRLFAIHVPSGEAFDHGAARELVPGSGLSFERGYAVGPGGTRFLAIRLSRGAERAPSLTLEPGGVHPSPPDQGF